MKKINVFKDLQTPKFNNHREKQAFYKMLSKTFMRSKIDQSEKGVSKKVTNRYITEMKSVYNILMQRHEWVPVEKILTSNN